MFPDPLHEIPGIVFFLNGQQSPPSKSLPNYRASECYGTV